MARSGDERVLWTHANLECVMISRCSGAELQLRRVAAVADREDDAILLREIRARAGPT